MNETKLEKLNRFLDFYTSIHALDDAYTYEGASEEHHHKAASRQLFEDSVPFLNRIPLNEISSVLDIGMGYGFHCNYFAEKGLKTTGITTHLTDSLIAQAKEKERYTVKKMDMHFLDFPDESFDLLWSHHSLEHSFSLLLALREWYRVLKPGGYLAVTVPPHKEQIVSGHFNVGWNIGQLMYLLGISGYDLKSGLFLEEGYNVRALVRRPVKPIEPTGLSWMFNLKKHLPDSIQSKMKEAPNSLGKLQFNGALREVTNNKCIEKDENRNNTLSVQINRLIALMKNILKKWLGS